MVFTVINGAMKGFNSTGKLLSVLFKNKNLCPLYFHFSYLYLFLAGNIIVYPPSQGTNKEKYFIH